MKENNNKKFKLTTLSLILVIALVIGITYAAFNFTGIGNLVNSISTETVTMVYTEGTNKISLENALPTEDETGMKLTTGDNVFDFTVYIKATNKQAIAYEVTAQKDQKSTLGDNDVRIYLEKSLDKTNYEKVSDPSGYVPILENDKFGAKTGEMILDTGTTSREQTFYYKLRMWVSKDYNVASESRFFTITVNVYGVGSNEIDVETIKLSDSDVTLKQNESKQLSYEVTPDNASDKRVTWTSSNTDVAVVDSNGNVTGIGEGKAVITATAKDKEKATCNFTITKPDPTGITMSANELNIKTNKTVNLTATVEPENVNDATLTWTSSDEDLVAIEKVESSSNAKRRAPAKTTNRTSTVALKTNTKTGTATITVETVNGIKKVINVAVKNQQAEGVSIDKTNLDMITGSSEQLTATITPDDTIDKTITWSSSNNDVATVDQTGKVTAVAPGNATITATAVGGAKAESTIKVQNPLPTSVTATEKEVNMKSGTTHQLSATVKPDNARSKVLTYTSSNPAVASVSDTGLVTALGVGTSTITLKTINGLTDTVTINVTNVKYTVNHNKMNIDGNGYTKADTETGVGKVGDTITPSVKTYTGFTSPETQSITLTEEDATIDYNYERNKYTLSVTASKGSSIDGSTASGEYYYDTEITLKGAALDGYTWSKWSDGVEDSTRTFKIDKNTTVSTVVTTDTYTITYNLDGGTLTGETTTYNVDDTDITLPTPTKSGYTFKGWTDEAGNSVTSIPTGSTGNKVFNANWEIVTYEISYTLGENATVDPANPTTYTVDTAEFTFNNPTRTGYTFDGWTGSNGTTKQTTVKVAKGTTGKLNYTANWTPHKYTVTYIMDGGVNPETNPTYYNIENGELKITDPTRTGYTFAGWTGTGLSAATKGLSIPAKSTGDRTYTANWSINSYTATFNGNGGSNGTSITKPYGEQLGTLPGSSRSGYQFLGWFTSQSGGTQISSGTTMPLNGATYYAHWTPKTYTITVTAGTGTSVSGGGNCTYGQTVNFSGSANTNYTWNGWSDGNSAYSRTTTCDGNKTFTTNAGTYNPPTYTTTRTGSNGWSADYTCSNGTGTMTACYYNGTKCDGGYNGSSYRFYGCTDSASNLYNSLLYSVCSTSFGDSGIFYGGGMSSSISC